MKLFDERNFFMIITGKEMREKATEFAKLHRVMTTKVDTRGTNEVCTISFTTRLKRAELVNRLRTKFGDTCDVRMRSKVVFLTKREDAL